jgi:hypothetical protein
VEAAVLLSNGGASTVRSSGGGAQQLIVGTVDGVFVLSGSGADWSVVTRALEGCAVAALTQLPSGTLIAATHGLGVARSTDGGDTWVWCNDGIDHLDLWAARSGVLQGRDVAVVGSLPAHLMISTDDGAGWTELPALRKVESTGDWYFPPPPHIGHVKEIVIDGDRLFVGIEIGALLRSEDFGATFTDLKMDPDPRECDVHRLLIDPRDHRRLLAAVGIVGFMRSSDDGRTWTQDPIVPSLEYPDALVMHPDRPDLLFVAAGVGWPQQWYARGRAQGRVARSADGGATWERLLGGLPDGQRSLFSALSIDVHEHGFSLFTADTDGQVFVTLDGGDRWTMIADIAPVSKGEFHRALAKGRPRIAGVDDIVVSASAARRLQQAEPTTSNW